MPELLALFAQIEIAATNLLIVGVISLAAGILILVVPRVLNYVVAIYLIVIGLLWIIAGIG